MQHSSENYGMIRNPLAERLRNLFWEYRLGISTRGIVDVDYPDSYHYATMFYSTIQKVLRELRLQPSDVFVDIGSGKGRVLCCAARHQLKKVIGVDLSEQFCKEAQTNAGNMRGRRSPISINKGFAQEFDYSEGTVFTLFNPFGAATLQAVLAKIRDDVNGKSSSVRIAYANPMHDAEFAKHSWLEKYETWDRAVHRLEHSVSFYRSR